jgi:hypothetical protein
MNSPHDASNPRNGKAVRRTWLSAFGVSLGTAILIVSPFLWLGTASGHDIAFHASSWLDVAGQWKEGIVFPRWCEWANNGFGEPRFIFYPPLSWMLGAALGFLVPWKAVSGTFIVLAQTLAGVFMFALARRFFSPGAALFAAACYVANPYALLVVYMRSDFAEQLAWAFLPALLLAALQLSGLMQNRWRSTSGATAVFALLFAGMWLSNAPAGVMASYSIALLFAWAAISEKSLCPLLHGIGGLALGFGLACFYLVPAAYEQRWVDIGQALSSGLQPAQNFLYTNIADPEHNVFNWIASSVAVLLKVLTWIAAIMAYQNIREGNDSREKKALWQTLLVLGAVATFLMLHPSAILWEHLPKLRFVQFPWRWMGILAVAYACFGAAAVAHRRVAWIWGGVVVLAVAGTATYLVKKAWWDSEDIPTLQDAIANGRGFDGTDEYDPARDDHTDLPAKADRVQILAAERSESSAPKVQVQIVGWTAEERDLTVTSPRPLKLAIRLLDYPAWQVEVNGRVVTPESLEGTTQMILPLLAGTDRIHISFRRTPDRTVGNALSFVGLVLCGIFLRKRRSRALPAGVTVA